MLEGRGGDTLFVEVSHCIELFVVDRPIIEATIELVKCLELTTLIYIDDATLYDFADSSGTLALQMNGSFAFGPINEICATEAARVAHIAKGNHRVSALLLCVVVTLKVLVDEELRHCKHRQETKEADKSLLKDKVINYTSTVLQKDVVLFFLFLLFETDLK